MHKDRKVNERGLAFIVKRKNGEGVI